MKVWKLTCDGKVIFTTSLLGALLHRVVCEYVHRYGVGDARGRVNEIIAGIVARGECQGKDG